MSDKANTVKPSRKGDMPADERIRERNERLIIKAGIDVFSRKGFDGTRISEIAEASGLPKANVYYYFESKEVIYRTVVAHLIKEWDDALDHIQADREPAEALEAYIKAKLEYTRRNSVESRLFASEIIRGAQFLTRIDRAHTREVTDRAVAVVEGWIVKGLLKPVDVRHLFIMLWSATQFYGDFEPLARDALRSKRLTGQDYSDAANTILQTVLHGLTPTAPI